MTATTAHCCKMRLYWSINECLVWWCVFVVQVHPFQSGTDSAVFAVSFGIFIVPVTLFFVILLALGAVLSGGSLPELHLSTCFLPGTPQSRCSQSLFMIVYDSVHNFCQPACFLPLFSGVLSGMLWNAGNIASIYAVQPPLGFAVGYPVTQVRIAAPTTALLLI